jgi:hypothetical protein
MAIGLVAICQRFECSPKAIELAMQCTKPSEFIAALRAENMGPDAIQSLSRMMPKEKAVEWAEQSARLAGEKAGLSPEEVKALDAAQAWSANPTDDARRAAATAAAKLPANSPAMWAANAAAFSEPMAVPKGVGPLLATDDLTAQMATGSVQLSAAKLSPGGVPELLKAPEIPGVPKMPEMNKLPLDQSTLLAVQEAVLPQAMVMTSEQCAQTTKMVDPFLDLGVKFAELVPGWS